jgi:class 3 adenylate cyclase
MDRYGIERPSREVAIPLFRRRPDSTVPRPFLPKKGQEEKAAEPQGVDMKRSAQAVPQVESPSWEQKLVAVLAVEIIWPVVTGSEALRYEPWTLATRWEQRIVEKVQGFGGIILQRAPSLYLVAFGLPQTLEQLPQRAVQAALALRRLVAVARNAVAREPCPAVRQTLHWGLLLVDVQARDSAARLLPIGETVGLPVRLLGQAAPEEILVSDQMRGLIDRWYELQVCDGPVEAGPSEEWLAGLVERVAGVPILVLTTYRHGYRPLWLDKSYTTQLSLQRLTPLDSASVLQAVLHNARVPEALAQEILARADGNPFFLEELTRIVVECGDQRLPLTVPDTVHAVLSARIDRLPTTGKRLLQAAAVVGTEVPLVLLQAIVEFPEEMLHMGLTRLQAAKFLYESGLFPDLTYTFKHALTHEVVYASLAAERRRLLHEHTAQAIEALFHDRLAEHYSGLVHHYSRSGNTTQTVDYL